MNEEQVIARGKEIYGTLRLALTLELTNGKNTTDNCVITAITALVAEWFNVAALNKAGALDFYLEELQRITRSTKIVDLGSDPITRMNS